MPRDKALRSITITRMKNAAAETCADFVAVEEPLEIRVGGRSVAVVMRTPGHDRELAAGFLVTEGIVRRRDDVLDIVFCGEATTRAATAPTATAGGMAAGTVRAAAGRAATAAETTRPASRKNRGANILPTRVANRDGSGAVSTAATKPRRRADGRPANLAASSSSSLSSSSVKSSAASSLRAVPSPHAAPSPRAAPDGNRLDVLLAPGCAVDLARLTRHVFTSSSCGICSRATIEAVQRNCAPLAPGPAPRRAVLVRLPARLRAAQSGFDATGGLHASALFDAAGRLVVAREDVGRHNALDKVIGHAFFAERLPLAGHVLLVSGRVSFEIVQKALAAGIPCIAAISAPTSAAVELARASGQVLVGFLRGARMNVYAGTLAD